MQFNETKVCDWLSKFKAYRYLTYALTLLVVTLSGAALLSHNILHAVIETFSDVRGQIHRYLSVMLRIEQQFQKTVPMIKKQDPPDEHGLT